MAKKSRRNKSKEQVISPSRIILAVIVMVVVAIMIWMNDNSSQSYKQANGQSGAALKTAMHDIIRKHTYLDFDDKATARYWWDNYFKKTDWSPKGYFIDMYSNEKHSDYMGGKVQNREHCMPRSWWGKREKYTSYDANGDLHNLFPADYNANAAKSNLPLGEVGIARFDNGVSKVGTNTYPNGYRGPVFEPSDEYKGDFARVYFYMVTCYEDYAHDWKPDGLKTMLAAGTYPGFQSWALNMLMKWNKQDPVSEKEIARNQAVYELQGNRNPFIDNPALADHIWGDQKNEPLSITGDNKMNRQSELKDLFLKFINELK